MPLPGELGRVDRGGDGLTNLVWSPREFRAVQPFTSPGILITFGNDGEIAGMWYFWQDLQPVGEYPLVSPEEAVERLKNCDATFTSIGPPAPSVSDVRIEYTGVPPSGPFQYFVPVYHFGNDLESWGTPEANGKRMIEGLGVTNAWVVAVDDRYIEAPPSK